jgi:hypothetical protein
MATRMGLLLDRYTSPDFAPPRRVVVGVFAAGALLLIVLGRNLWFIEDDWSYLLWHDAARRAGDYDRWLNLALNGHWVAVPQVVYTATMETFGLSSYWPFVLPSLIMHLVTVELARRLAIRAGAHPTTALVVSALLLVLGSADEFLLHSPITSYQYSIVALLATLLILERESDLHWLHAVAAVLLLIGVMASGFGTLFLPGVAFAALWRRRWTVAAVVLAPAVVALAWWWPTWGDDQSAERVPGPRSLAPQFAVRGIEAVFEVLTSVPLIAGIALLATIWFGIVTVPASRASGTVWPLGIAVATTFAGLGLQRIGFGVEAGATPKYTGVAAMLLAPAFAVAVDASRRLGRLGIGTVYALLAVSIVVNVGAAHYNMSERGERAAESRRVFELVAGSPELWPGREAIAPSPISPDVQVDDLAYLVELDAFDPRPPVTDEEREVVLRALGVQGG